jgi:hypothetical protein
MATDKSEPRMGLIFRIGFLAVFTVIGVRASLMSYFDEIERGEFHRKFGEIQPEALQNLRASERDRLTAGALPISVAMQHLATQGRVAVSPEIAASASRDTAPLAGWSKMSADVPSAMTAPPSAPETATASSASPDAGTKAPPPADAGAPARKGHGKRPQ